MSHHTDSYTLKAGDSTLSIDADGHLLGLVGTGITWHGQPGPFWQIVLQAPSTPSVLGMHQEGRALGAPRIQAGERELVLSYVGLDVAGETVPIDVTATISARGDQFEFTFAVVNGSTNWTVRELRAPMIAVPLPEGKRPALLWPNGAGERFPDPTHALVMSVAYPTRLFVPWMAMDAGSAGLYVASHDASLQTVTLNTDACRLPGAIVLSVGLFPFCGPGEDAHTAPIVLSPYDGSWHEAARRYRRWADSWFKPVAPPEWVREISGWQLVILKQQNGEIHWPYTDLDKLIELGRENGLNVLGLFGWTEGGHDRRYPIYDPEPAMGGEAALREGIEKAHAAGQKVILYTNGQLRDILTDWHEQYGHQSAALSERGDSYGESWLKYNDAPPRRMTYGCQSSRIWSDTLLELAKKLERLGADGMIFDQLGSCHPMFCFSEDHEHDRPSLATGPGVAANMARIQAEMQAINPEFIIMVEHVTDAVNQHIDFTHGCGVGFNPDGRGFPEMLRFTLPEIGATQRHATPVMERNTANWACLYGFAHEVEYRYWPDRLYIENGIAPEIADYRRIGSPPNIPLMQELDPREASAYLRQVIEFEQRNADLLRKGTFNDSLGFSIEGTDVKAKSYVNGSDFGVLIWNPTDEPQTAAVTAPATAFSRADAPGSPGIDPQTPIPPQSIRLLRYTVL